MSGTGTLTFGQEVEAALKTVWGDLEQVGDAVLGAFKKTATTVWGAVSTETIAFAQGMLTVYANDLKSGTMTLSQATELVTGAAKSQGLSDLESLGMTALQALIANLIAAL